MGTIAILPARGQSKGIQRKNLQPLGGKPLLAWTIEAACDAKLLDRVIVSTEDAEIAACARRYGAEVPFMRPEHLSGSDVHSVHVVLHALDCLKRSEGGDPKIVVMLLPTSPFRCAQHIDSALHLFQEKSADVVLSVCQVHDPIHALRFVRSGRLLPVDGAARRNLQRQDAEPVYAVNGAIYIAKSSVLREEGTFHVPQNMPFMMTRTDSINIDEADDLLLARALMAWRQAASEQHEGKLDGEASPIRRAS